MNDLAIIAALVTPFAPDDTVNHNVLRAIVEHTIDLGVHGFYVCGTTGEGFQMSTLERRQTLETVCHANDGRCEIFVNISHMDFREVCVLADHAYEVGADKISALPPIYNAIAPEELLNYMRDLLNRVRLPFALYHIPLLSGRGLGISDVKQLAQHPSFVGVKFTSEDTSLLGRLKQIDNGRLRVWSGRDAFYLSNLSMGADGAVGSSFQLMGDLFNEVGRTYRTGQIDLARRLQVRINEIHAALSKYGFFQSYKACFDLIGIPAGHCRKPFSELPVQAKNHLQQTLTLLRETREEYEIPTHRGPALTTI